MRRRVWRARASPRAVRLMLMRKLYHSHSPNAHALRAGLRQAHGNVEAHSRAFAQRSKRVANCLRSVSVWPISIRCSISSTRLRASRHFVRPRLVRARVIRGAPVRVPRLTSSLSVRFATISLADCGVTKQRRAIAAFVDSEWSASSSASSIAYWETLKPIGRSASSIAARKAAWTRLTR
jgi:hypothetical protein